MKQSFAHKCGHFGHHVFDIMFFVLSMRAFVMEYLDRTMQVVSYGRVPLNLIVQAMRAT